MRSMMRSSPIGSVQKTSQVSQTHPKTAVPTMGEQKGIVLRDYLGYSADRIASLESADVLHRGER
jgi:hypothetical protein